MKTFYLSLLLLFSGISLYAEKVGDAMWGFTFESPQGWKYQKDMNGAMLGHDTVPGLILLFPHEFKDMNSLKAEMQKGLTEEEGYLRLQGNLGKMGRNECEDQQIDHYEVQQVKARGYGTLSPYGGGTIVITMSTPESFSSQLSAAGSEIINSMKYHKSDSSSVVKRFIGKWSTYSKYSENHVYLYPDGTFENSRTSSYGNSDTSLGATWGMAGDSHGRGRWQVKGNLKQGQIIFTSPSGETTYYDYQVHVKNGQTYWSEYYFGNDLYARSPLR